jgi:hypothetical protein
MNGPDAKLLVLMPIIFGSRVNFASPSGIWSISSPTTSAQIWYWIVSPGKYTVLSESILILNADTDGIKRQRRSTPALIKRILFDLITNHTPSNQPAFVIMQVNESYHGNISAS